MNLLSPVLRECHLHVVREAKPSLSSNANILGRANKKPEEADSLAALGMTNQKSKNKNNSNNMGDLFS